jgi:hypothetical protein
MIKWPEFKFRWLEALARDKATRGLPHDIAIILGTKYLNSRSKDAWPAIARLANDLCTDRRAVQRALDKLVCGRWLRRIRGGKGRSDTNHYALPLELPGTEKGGLHAAPRSGADAALRSSLGRSARHCKGGLESSERAVPRPPESGNNPGGNPRETADAAHSQTPRDNLGQGREEPPNNKRRSTEAPHGGQRRRRIPLPEEWILGPAQIKIAAELTDWNDDEIHAQFSRFLTWHRANRPYSFDWMASWNNWCIKGAEYDAKRPKQSYRESSLRGLKEWLDNQGKTKH